MKILVTGTAGFIGCEVALKLLSRGDEVLGIDNLNDYYDVALKKARLDRFAGISNFSQKTLCVSNATELDQIVAAFKPQRVIHLAAQAGVRYSLTNPQAYLQSNLVGFGNILEVCRHHDVEHLVYASSSSVYGANTKQPYSVEDPVDHPVSLYASTKKANELMAHTYSHLYQLPTTGLRFFTVYGPWGRPDMSYFKFIQRILAGEPIDVYNYGKHRRDFTYIDDIVEGVIRTTDNIATGNTEWNGDKPDPSSSKAPYKIYNIGSNEPVELLRFIEILEDCLGKKAEKNLLPMQPGDVPDTYANVDALIRDVGYKPDKSFEDGIANFVSWYRDFYSV